MAIDKNRWYEQPDSKPMAIPAGFRVPPTLAEQVARLVRSHALQRDLAQAGAETFEEADDFDVPDDPPDPTTPYEPQFDPALGVDLTPQDILRDRDRYAQETNRRVEAAKAAKAKKQPPAGSPPAAPPAGGSQEPEKPGS